MSSGRSSNNRQRIVGLNSLRALAVIGVLLYHAFPSVIQGGYFGVLIFFAVSGYLGAYTMREAIRSGRINLFSYYWKRFLRIYPALIIVVLASLGVLSMIDMNRMINAQEEALSIVGGYNNYWQMKVNADYFADLTNTSPFTHLWYIAILIQYEILWPILAWIYSMIRRHVSPGAALGGFFLITALSFFVMPVKMLMSSEINITNLYYATECRVFTLLAGSCLGLMHAEGLHLKGLRSGNRVIPLLIWIVFVLLSAFIFYTVSGTYLWVYCGGMQVYTLFICLIIEMMIMNRKNLRGILDDRLSNFLTKYSYGIYLWQYPVLFLTGIAGLKGGFAFPLQLALILILSIWMDMFLKPLTGKKKSGQKVRTARA